MPDQSNDAARDLWSQMFARAAEHPAAAKMDIKHHASSDTDKARKAFAAAGWNEASIDAMMTAVTERHSAAPVSSPGVNPSAEAFHASLCDDVEEEMARQGLNSQGRVARGIEPRTAPFASKIGVIMTNQSIITAGAFTYRFCGLIAKAFNRTIMLDPWFWQSDAWTEERARLLLRANLDIARYWHQIFMSFAMSGTHATVPFEPSSPSDVWLAEQVARAIELFIVAHEYGHHHLEHGRDVDADFRAEEFAADQFALRMGKPIGESDRLPIWNPYLASGSGGVIILKALEQLRLYERALGGKLVDHDTHPPVDDRIARFDSLAVLQPQELAMLKGFRTASTRVMDATASLLADFLSVMPDDARADLTAMRNRIWDELPIF